MTEVAEYQQWLASGVSNREVVETLDVHHAAWEPIRIVNADRSILATIETGAKYEFMAGRFYWEPPETTDTTNQTTTIAISALEGRVYERILGLSADERLTPITLTYRLYFFDDPSEPLIDPPPVWYVSGLEATREAVRAEVRAQHLRIQKIGLYYTENEFPALRFL